LRDGLKQRLPDYMVPSLFMVLDALPLTPNGKIERKALPVPQAGIAGADFVAPRTTAEQTLAAIWSEVLKLERVGVHDDFFELGGHSLLATRVLARLRDALSVELPLRALFEAPRLAGLAVRIETEQRQGGGIMLPPLAMQVRPERLPLSYAQERPWFTEQLGLAGSAYN